MKSLNTRYFFLKDIETTVIVEFARTQKEIFGWLDDMIENLQYDWFHTDDTFCILYKDGTEEYINSDYDGHKVKRNNIASIVYSNDCSYIVYGNFEINEYGIVYTAYDEKIDNSNIVEIDRYIQ